jgi:hypothetical protein
VDNREVNPRLVRFFWWNVGLLVAINTVDILMLEHFTGGSWDRETFPMLRYSLRSVGIHASIWLIRALLYPVIFVLMCLPRTKYANYFVLTLNLLYFTAMLDWLSVLGVISSPK